MVSIQLNTETVKFARKYFETNGVSVAEWARAKGFSVTLVYQILEGRRKCLRGQSHKIAVALGIKHCNATSLHELQD